MEGLFMENKGPISFDVPFTTKLMSILKEVTEISVYAPVDIIEVVLNFFPIVENVTIY